MRTADWTSPDGSIELYQGECLEVMGAIDPINADMLCADPPYSSGGMFRGDRIQPVDTKYCHDGDAKGRPLFSGDNRDGRSFALWSTLWINAARRHVKTGGYAHIFTDWRQLPTATDTLQAGGFTWRGIAPWDKGGGARAPHKGYHRHQCEYLVWGSNGPLPKAEHDGPFPGCYRMPVRRKDKHHITGKPTDLLCELARVIPPAGRIFDPFAGSGTAGVAAALTGRGFVGIEQDPTYFAVMVDRITEALGTRKRAA